MVSMKTVAAILGAVLLVQGAVAVRDPKMADRKMKFGQVLEGSWKWEVTFDIFEGLIEGFFDFDKYPDLKSCASEIAEVYDDLDQAVQAIEQKDVHGVRQGLKLIGQSLDEVSDALRDCKAAEGDIESVIDALKGFKSPWSFVFHVGKDLLVNGVDIFEEISDAVNDWKAQSYRQCGEEIGEALNKLLIGA